MTSSNPNEPHRNTGLSSKYVSYPIESYLNTQNLSTGFRKVNLETLKYEKAFIHFMLSNYNTKCFFKKIFLNQDLNSDVCCLKFRKPAGNKDVPVKNGKLKR